MKITPNEKYKLFEFISDVQYKLFVSEFSEETLKYTKEDMENEIKEFANKFNSEYKKIRIKHKKYQ